MPPPNLRLTLPPGVRRPEPEPQELHLTLPAYAQRRVGGVGAGMVGARSSELLLASNIVARRALESLRYKQGIAYHVASNYLPTGPDRAHVTFWTDCEQIQAGAQHVRRHPERAVERADHAIVAAQAEQVEPQRAQARLPHGPRLLGN